MSEAPRGNQRGWHWKGKKRKRTTKSRHRHGNKAIPNNDRAHLTEGGRVLEQDYSGSRRVSDPINSRPSCSYETLPATDNNRTTGDSNSKQNLSVCDQRRVRNNNKSTSTAYRTVDAWLTPQVKGECQSNAAGSSCSSAAGQSASTSGITSTSTNGATVKEIPGFYYDPDKKRYFRLVPGHNNFNPLTRESLDKKHAEVKRLKMLENDRPSSKLQARHCKMNICSLQASLQTGQLTSKQFSRYAQEQTIRNLNLKPRKLNNFPDQYFDGESGDISVLQVDCTLSKVLMVVSHDSLSRIWQGTIACDRSNPRLMSLSDWKVLNIIGTKNTKITSASWISTDDGNNLQVIYSVSGGPMNTVQLVKCAEEEDGRNQVTYSYESNHELAWTCAWSNNPLTPGYLSIGSNKKALVVSTVAAEKWNVFSNHSDVLAQVFATRNPLLYNGTRRGEILGCDLRTLTGTRSDIMQRLRHQVGVCSVRLLKDENYLVAGDMNGQIRLWDLRQCLCVQQYKEHHNTHSYLPICIDSTENILYAVGEDRYTRFWSLKDGHLLRTIPCPLPQTPIAPSVVYSQDWQSGARGGLFLGVQRGLYWYPI